MIQSAATVNVIVPFEDAAYNFYEVDVDKFKPRYVEK